jgi:thiosulfate/3-mercaptopyruvate sulfurtransferase
MVIRAQDLVRHTQDSAWVVFDCRHDLGDTGKGSRLYVAGHVPGAYFAPVDTALSGTKNGRNGRHPLPGPEQFAEFLAAHGVTPATTVVAYDDVGGQFAARLWWLARWIGLSRVVLLDGGWPAWVAAGLPVSTEVPERRRGQVTARPAWDLVWSAEETRRRISDPGSALIDARAAERYRGDVEPIDPVAGHIPGAKNRFYKANLNPDLTFRPAEELRSEFAALLAGKDPAKVGHSCGSGITACANLFAMEYAGLGGSRLYAGSWSEWVSDPARPVERGAGVES